MKCPKCGKELRPSKKDPAYGLCDNCKKKFKIIRDANSNKSKHHTKLESTLSNQSKKSTNNRGYIVLIVIVISIVVIALFSCGGNDKKNSDEKTSSEQTEDDATATYITVCKQEVEKHIAGVNWEWGYENYQIRTDESNNTSIYTTVAIDGMVEKQNICVIATVNTNDGSYSCHYVSVGDKVYKDDGTVG